MKKLTIMLFIIISSVVMGKHNDHSLTDPLKNFREKKNIEALSPEQKDQLLILRGEYFAELKEIQENFRKLRKEANHCMMNNDEKKYEEVHDKMNELKIKREKIKQIYIKKINDVLKK